MKICIIGTGYVGLVAGVCFAENGNDVICVDKDSKKIEGLKRGKVPIYEPGLEELLKRNTKKERLQFTTNLKKAVKESFIIFIAVGTPQDDDGSADLNHVLEVAALIGKAMNGYKIIATKSTVPVGTTNRVRDAIGKETEHPFNVASNPEFLKEGAAVNDFMKPDRIIIGTDNQEAADIMKELYSPFVRTGNPILIMDIESAEMTKYAANAMLATRVSFMNELANLCEKVGADISDVRKGMGTDPRIGYSFLFPGVGYGGSCFPKDVKAIIRTAEENNYDLNILKAVDLANTNQREILVKKIMEHFGGNLKGRVIGIWGLSFKPNTDDIREAPSITIIKRLLEVGARIKAYDPAAMDEVKKEFYDRIKYSKKSYDALEGADALVLITEWNEFREPDFERILKLMNTPVVFDGRNIFNPRKLQGMGFTYYGVGRITTQAQSGKGT
ncbi:MAG: UDP-glucose 6-dehydrogenase [Deltaproteobacteria bacterium CG_4_8_14_3_um_filter_43_13]|nr:MAG: UDP-glucose 6-dehydrogenase [Deltaproteobacteria bacterium CG_4_8_14_3_um_filter_43_13]PIZ20211.1 MAG: UDP-glucose 6-dehydrogenase [Deltaproteobacteria bacterium CG_4_10_14_0_8_um_filter_43_12]